MAIDMLGKLTLFTAGSTDLVASVEVLFLFLLFVGITGVTAVGFAAWAAFHLIRSIALLSSRVLLGPSEAKKPAKVAHAICPDPVCRGVNPEVARFCRRCGRMLRGPARPS